MYIREHSVKISNGKQRFKLCYSIKTVIFMFSMFIIYLCTILKVICMYMCMYVYTYI